MIDKTTITIIKDDEQTYYWKVQLDDNFIRLSCAELGGEGDEDPLCLNRDEARAVGQALIEFADSKQRR